MLADDPLPPDEPLTQRVRIGLAKIGIALKQQAWAEAGGRGLTPGHPLEPPYVRDGDF